MRAAVAQIVIKEYVCIQYVQGRWRYEGQVNQDGKYQGRGVLSHTRGVRYEGEFRNDEYHGPGTHTYPDGTVKSGRWENSKFLG